MAESADCFPLELHALWWHIGNPGGPFGGPNHLASRWSVWWSTWWSKLGGPIGGPFGGPIGGPFGGPITRSQDTMDHQKQYKTHLTANLFGHISLN